MKKYSRKHVYTKEGLLLPLKERTFKTNEGYDCVVVDGGSKVDYVTCKIEEYAFETAIDNIKKGKVKYPFHPSLYGRGFIGRGKYKTSENVKHTKVYDLWKNMLKRVYDEKYHKIYPSYKEVEIYEAWLNFQNFADWFHEASNYREGWQLDKDLLSGSKKIYSPKTCIFIPPALNTFLANKYTNNTSGYIGVCWKKQNKKWRVQITDIETGKYKFLGYFDNSEEAAEVYKEARKEQAQIWKDRMKGLLLDNTIRNIK